MKKIVLILVLICATQLHAELTPYQQCIRQQGYDALVTTNQSASDKITLDRPMCAYINMDSIEALPQAKGVDSCGWIEWYDPTNDVYFKKRVILNAQGNSSMSFPKKNIAVDFCEDAWEGDETTSIQLGDWVAQDGYHLKAYYTDWLRGVGAIGYWIFDDIVADHNTYLDRAGVTDYKEGARCYPDGFPCIVYLQGKFYGVYAWQLKKHRDNMGMDKKDALHIHLDGTLSDVTFWQGEIDWTQFEVRNPKNLYCVTIKKGKYAKYDGDNPTELIDETMEFYDPTNEDHVRTAQVKHAIEKLSKYYAEISQSATPQQIKEAIANRFDVTSLIDYFVLERVINNYDGTAGKNCQWFTYDGTKWFVAPYDLDAIFGNVASGEFILPATWSCWWGDYKHPAYIDILRLCYNTYEQDIQQRYRDLRQYQAISLEQVHTYLDEWYNAIGTNYYSLEYSKWSNSLCIRPTICNQNWQMVMDWTGFGSAIKEFDPNYTYHAGDRCCTGICIFEATATTTGVFPYQQIGYVDSLQRYKDWITERIRLLDEWWGCTTDVLPIRSNITPANRKYYNLLGMEVQETTPGIVISNDGKKRINFDN
ncbi:MAG: CotH kinase family protein [Prevotellaceae bacterium]|nr:CotH kinase family protein [Candidatus Faecinaster equi]